MQFDYSNRTSAGYVGLVQSEHDYLIIMYLVLTNITHLALNNNQSYTKYKIIVNNDRKL